MAVLHTFASICMTGNSESENFFWACVEMVINDVVFINSPSAPSGSYGTMVYIAKAVASVLDCLPQHGDMDCTIS